MKYPPLYCTHCGRQQKRITVIERMQEGKTFLFCEEDGTRLPLPEAQSLLPALHKKSIQVSHDDIISRMRTTYETALVRVKGFIRDRKDTVRPSCFISYAWGNASHTRWVSKLAEDLQNADIDTVLDQVDNAAIGSIASATLACLSSRLEIHPTSHAYVLDTIMFDNAVHLHLPPGSPRYPSTLTYSQARRATLSIRSGDGQRSLRLKPNTIEIRRSEAIDR
jgi:hypothetical protein